MKTMNTLALVSLLLLGACKKGDDAGGNPPPPVAPAAAAGGQSRASRQRGVDGVGMTGETINLSASASSDPDADTLTYSWVIASGPAGATLTNATQSTASFQATAAGTYVLEVTVRDPGNLSSVDSLSLTISSPPAPPVFGISGLPAHVVQGEVIDHRGAAAGASRRGRRPRHPAQQQPGRDRSARVHRRDGRRHAGVIQRRRRRDRHGHHYRLRAG